MESAVATLSDRGVREVCRSGVVGLAGCDHTATEIVGLVGKEAVEKKVPSVSQEDVSELASPVIGARSW